MLTFYSRMRSHLFTNTRTMQKRAWHTDKSRSLSNGHDWSEHRPYNNVIWIQFLLGYLKKQIGKLKGPVLDDLKNFISQTAELSKRMDPRTKIENGAFESATQVLEYVIEQGWVSCEQAEVVGTSEPSILGLENLDIERESDTDQVHTHDPSSEQTSTRKATMTRHTSSTTTTRPKKRSEEVENKETATEELRSTLRRSPRKKKSEK